MTTTATSRRQRAASQAELGGGGGVFGVCGSLGMVGSAVSASLRDKGVSVRDYDIRDGKDHTLETALLETDAVFLCLPTLYSAELQEYDKAAVHEVCGRLRDAGYRGAVVLKSTVEPGTTQALADEYGLRMAHNPEFLTARTARKDFDEQNHAVIGRSSLSTHADVGMLTALFSEHYPAARISVCSSTESELLKIAVNSFYATKVQYFNEVLSAAERVGADYRRVRDMMLANGWIHPMHTEVPGPDGKRSYGGACFPKDTNAFLQWLRREGCLHETLEGAVRGHDRVRPEND